MKEERSSLDNDPVFGGANDDVPKPDRVSKRFKFYFRKAGLSDREALSFHSCRHTTGSWLSMQGVPLRVISEILGHSSTQVTEMYSHLSPDVMDRAMEETFSGSWCRGVYGLLTNSYPRASEVEEEENPVSKSPTS
jgi:site-specific recombinase XerD